jgi:hypothetical protein
LPTPAEFSKIYDLSFLRATPSEMCNFFTSYATLQQAHPRQVFHVSDLVRDVILNISGGHWGSLVGILRSLCQTLDSDRQLAESKEEQEAYALKQLRSSQFHATIDAGESYRLVPTRMLAESECDWIRKLMSCPDYKLHRSQDSKGDESLRILEADGFLAMVSGWVLILSQY